MLPLTELGHSRQGQPNGGGSETGKQPPCRDGESKVYHSNAKCSYLPSRGNYTDYGGMALYPSSSQAKMTAKKKRQSMRSCSFKEWEGCTYRPPKTILFTINTDSHYTYSKLIMTVVHMRKLLYHKS